MRHLAPLLHLASAPPAGPAQGQGDDVSRWFALLAVGVLVVVVANWLHLGNGLADGLATVGSVLTAVVAVVAIILILFAVLVAVGAVTGIGL
jgi:hypothetical protein